jgi:hypothetical protein
MPKARIFEEDAESLRRRFAESEASFAFSAEAAAARWGDAGSRKGLLPTLHEAIPKLLLSQTETGYGGTDLSEASRHFLFGEEIGEESTTLSKATHAIWRVTGPRVLLPPDDPRWTQAYDMARAMICLEPEHPIMWFERVACDYAKRLKTRGFSLTAARGGYRFADGEIERATAIAQSRLSTLGIIQALRGITLLMLQKEQVGFGMYLFARHSSTKPRPAACPYGFLLNLALRCPVVATVPGDAQENFKEAVELATEITAALDLETFLQPAGFLVDTPQMEQRLRQAVQFDHLFAIRQWPIPYVNFLIQNFFGSDLQDRMTKSFGWNVGDGLTLWQWVAPRIAAPYPWMVTKAELTQCGVPPARLDALLADLCHRPGTVNAEYRSPLAATDVDVTSMAFMKPFVPLGEQGYVVPVPSAAGPAFYEAIMVPVWRAFPEEAKKLAGEGTERVVLALLRQLGILEPLHNERYRLKSPQEKGEMDVVVETSDVILIFECKAKALTRAAMAGAPDEALLDFSAGVLASQVQALRHERILRSRSVINFESDRRLEWKGRKIVRISVTMLDLGCIQDTTLLWGLTPALLRAAASAPPEHPKADKVKELNNALQKLRDETAALQKLGVSFADQQSGTKSFSAGQLAAILADAGSIAEFVRSISMPISYGTLNPLYEYLLRKQLSRPAATGPSPNAVIVR